MRFVREESKIAVKKRTRHTFFILFFFVVDARRCIGRGLLIDDIFTNIAQDTFTPLFERFWCNFNRMTKQSQSCDELIALELIIRSFLNNHYERIEDRAILYIDHFQ